MARRAGQVVVAVVAIMAVAVLARPSVPDVPPPFLIDRETASPQPVEPTPTPATPETPPTPAEDPDGDRYGPLSRLRIHTLDPATLVPRTMPAQQVFEGQDFVLSELSGDGRLLAVLHAGDARDDATLRVYDTERLAVVRQQGVPHATGLLRFGPDAGDLLWLTHTRDGAWELGGLPLRGGLASAALPSLALPDDFQHRDLQALAGGLVAVAGYTVEEPAPAGEVLLGPLRLLVADLARGDYVVDAVLPTTPGRGAPEGQDGLAEVSAGLGWDVERGLLHVVHADRDALSTVDLATGEVVEELVAGGDALAARVLRALVPAARAGGPHEGRWREVIASPDGRRLYASGFGLHPYDASGEQREGRWFDLPLLVADLEAGSLRALEEVRGHVRAVSADGRFVAVLGRPEAGEASQVLRVLDGATFEPRWEREAEYVSMWFTPDGEHLVAQDWRPRDGGGSSLEVLDVADGTSRQRLPFEGFLAGVHPEGGVVVEVDRER